MDTKFWLVRLAFVKSVPFRMAYGNASPQGSSLPRVRFAPTNFVFVRFAERNFSRRFTNVTPEKSAPVRFAEEKFVALIVAPRKSAFVRFALLKLVPVRSKPEKFQPVMLPVTVAFLATTVPLVVT